MNQSDIKQLHNSDIQLSTNISQQYIHIGNYKQYADNILSEYCLPYNKSTYDWSEKKYMDLPTYIMKICNYACVKSGDEELLKSNPYVVVERHHHILTKDGKVKNTFGVHCDFEGPASGPCRSVLFYYQIDDDIDDVGLNFYEFYDEEKTMINEKTPVDTFIPISGDVITFDNNIPHSPCDFKTNSETPKIRGLISIFIKHTSIVKSTTIPDKTCCIIM